MALVRLLVIALAGLSLSCLAGNAEVFGIQAGKPHLEKTMRILKVTMIVRLFDKAVETDGEGNLVCDDPDMLSDLAFYAKRRLPVSVEFDTNTRRITSVSSAPNSSKFFFAPVEGPRDRITLELLWRPTQLYLRKDHPRFHELYSRLQQAEKEKRGIALGVLPGGYEIEDVRIGDWE